MSIMTKTEKTDDIIILEGAAAVAFREQAEARYGELGESRDIDEFLAELQRDTEFAEAAERKFGKPWNILYEEGHRLPSDAV